MIEKQFDALLSYSRQDKPQVRAIAQELKRRGIKPWLDEEQISPGQSIQDAFARAISSVKSVVVFIGPQGLAKLQEMALQSLVTKTVETHIRIIPVFLPGAEEIPQNPGYLSFLRQIPGIVFNNDLHDDQALDSLEWGITGQRPNLPNLPLNTEKL